VTLGPKLIRSPREKNEDTPDYWALFGTAIAFTEIDGFLLCQ
jgi:hypothetical protein